MVEFQTEPQGKHINYGNNTQDDGFQLPAKSHKTGTHGKHMAKTPIKHDKSYKNVHTI